jgi:hypothetical protein
MLPLVISLGGWNDVIHLSISGATFQQAEQGEEHRVGWSEVSLGCPNFLLWTWKGLSGATTYTMYRSVENVARSGLRKRQDLQWSSDYFLLAIAAGA